MLFTRHDGPAARERRSYTLFVGSISAISRIRSDEFTQAAAEGSCPDDAVPDEYQWETSLSHMIKVATEARSRSAASWTKDRFGNPSRK